MLYDFKNLDPSEPIDVSKFSDADLEILRNQIQKNWETLDDAINNLQMSSQKYTSIESKTAVN
jgi:hypothetical protein